MNLLSFNKAEFIVVDISAVKYWSLIVFCFFMTPPIEGGSTAESGAGPDCLGPLPERGHSELWGAPLSIVIH